MNLITKISTLGLCILFASLLQANSSLPLLERADEAHSVNSHHIAIKYYEDFFETNQVCHAGMNKLAASYWALYKIESAMKWYQVAYNCDKMPVEHLKKFGDVLTANQYYEFANKVYNEFNKKTEATDTYLVEKTKFAILHSFEKQEGNCKKLKTNSSFSECSPAFYNGELASVFSGYIFSPNLNLSSADKKSNSQGESEYQFLNKKNKSIQLALSSLSKELKIESFAFAPNGIDLTFTVSQSFETRRPIIGEDNLVLYTAKVDQHGRLYQVREFPYSIANHSRGYGNFSQNGSELYFSSNQPGGEGGYDLYVSTRNESGWSTPTNLGPFINSPGNEISPYSNDGIIYFSSDYYLGMGGFDIFMAAQSKENWTISNLGSNINTATDDYGFILGKDAKTGYFTSNINGATSREDIYKVGLIDHPILLKTKPEISLISTDKQSKEIFTPVQNATSKSKVKTVLPIVIEKDEGKTQVHQISAVPRLFQKNRYQLILGDYINGGHVSLLVSSGNEQLLSQHSVANAFNNWKTNGGIK